MSDYATILELAKNGERELVAFLEGRRNWLGAVSQIQTETRHYAKRQISPASLRNQVSCRLA